MTFSELIFYLASLPAYRNPVVHLTYVGGFYELAVTLGKHERQKGETQPVKIFFSNRCKNPDAACMEISGKVGKWLEL